MSDIFIKICNLSLTASWIVLAVLLLRLLLQRAPKWSRVILWGVVALRLVFPFSLESVLSLIPSAEPIPPDITFTQVPMIDSGFEAFDQVVNPILSQTLAPTVTNSVNPMQIIVGVSACVWVVGIALMLIYATISYVRLHLRVRPSINYRNNVYLCDDVDTPFLLGIFKPRIYLPSDIPEEQAEHVIAHERAHIRRKDHLWKPLGFVLLSVYWFNPILWIAYILLCRDIELACDEKVIRSMSNEAKKSYSEALVSCSLHRRLILACPLAFGEVGVKRRIQSVLNYKKPAFWIILLALIASVVLAVCFLTDPITDHTSPSKPSTPPTSAYKSVTVLMGESESEHESIALYPTAVFSSKSSVEAQNGHYLIHTTWFNSGEQEMTYGESYTIEYLENDVWCNIETKEHIFHMIGILLAPNSHAETTYSTENFDLSRIGKYRLRCTFSLDGKKTYSAWITFFVVPAPSNIYTLKNISYEDKKAVREAYPQYCDLDTSEGLKVYVTQIPNTTEIYSCQLVSGSVAQPTPEELAQRTFTTTREMMILLSTYEIPMDQITLIPFKMPNCELSYTIDDTYRNRLIQSFGLDGPLSTVVEPVYDCLVYDVDGDHENELCILHGAPLYYSTFWTTLLIFELNDSQGIYSMNWEPTPLNFDYSFTVGDDKTPCVQATSMQSDSSNTLVYSIQISHYDGRIHMNIVGIN